ncbi:MAG: tyrosine-type recombinase/integrase [Anaerolineae bacterium]
MGRAAGKDRGTYQTPHSWGARWADVNGKMRSQEGFATKSEAKAYYDTRKAEVREERLFPEKAEARRRKAMMPTLESACGLYLELWQQKSSWQDDLRHMRYWLQELGPERKVDQVRPGDVEAYVLRRIREQKAPGTINREVQFLRHLYKLLIRDEWVLRNPTTPIKKLAENNMRVRYLAEWEEELLRSLLLPHQWRMVELAFLTGLRLGEQVGPKGLRRRWVDFFGGVIHVPESKHGAARSFPFARALTDAAPTQGQRIRQLLEELLGEHYGEYVFAGRSGGSKARPWVTETACQKMLAQAVASTQVWALHQQGLKPAAIHERLANTGLRLGQVVKAIKRGPCRPIEDLHWHDLRHTFASRLVMAGVPLRYVQELMGHRTLAMTERYSHLAPGKLREAVGA